MCIRDRGLLAGAARRADALYVLGDLFEAWPGDDDAEDPFLSLIHISEPTRPY